MEHGFEVERTNHLKTNKLNYSVLRAFEESFSDRKVLAFGFFAR